MKAFNIIFLFLLFFIFTVLSNANNNIVYLDIDKVMKVSKGGSSLLKKLNQVDKINFDNLKKIEDQLKSNEKDLISQKNILSNEEFQKKIDIFKKSVADYNQTSKNVRSDVSNTRIKNTKIFLNFANQVITKYSNDQSIDLILPKKNIIIGKTELDITDIIIELINKDLKEMDIK